MSDSIKINLQKNKLRIFDDEENYGLYGLIKNKYENIEYLNNISDLNCINYSLQENKYKWKLINFKNLRSHFHGIPDYCVIHMVNYLEKIKETTKIKLIDQIIKKINIFYQNNEILYHSDIIYFECTALEHVIYILYQEVVILKNINLKIFSVLEIINDSISPSCIINIHQITFAYDCLYKTEKNKYLMIQNIIMCKIQEEFIKFYKKYELDNEFITFLEECTINRNFVVNNDYISLFNLIVDVFDSISSVVLFYDSEQKYAIYFLVFINNYFSTDYLINYLLKCINNNIYCLDHVKYSILLKNEDYEELKKYFEFKINDKFTKFFEKYEIYKIKKEGVIKYLKLIDLIIDENTFI